MISAMRNINIIPLSQSILYHLVLILSGTLFLTLSSYIIVPILPVPVTMQTFTVSLIGAYYGWRVGGITVITWLAQGYSGMPVFAGGAGGIECFITPTAGYILAFPLSAMLTGWLIEKRADIIGSFFAIILGNMLCLILGASWLSLFIGSAQAISLGVLYFIPVTLLKSLLATFVFLATPKKFTKNT